MSRCFTLVSYWWF